MDEIATPYEIPAETFTFSPEDLRKSFAVRVGTLVALRIAVAPRPGVMTDFVVQQPETFAIVRRLFDQFQMAVEIPARVDAKTARHVEIWPCQEIIFVDNGAMEIVFDIGLLSLSTIARNAIEAIIVDAHDAARGGAPTEMLPDLMLQVDVRTGDRAFVLLRVSLTEAMVPLSSLLTIAASRSIPGGSYLEETADRRHVASVLTIVRASAEGDHVASTILRDTARLLGAQPHRVVDIFYATNRLLVMDNGDASYTSERGEGVTFGRCSIAIPASHRRGRLEQPKFSRFLVWRWNPNVHITILRTEPFDEERFYETLNAGLLGASRDDVLLFVHGYNVNFGEAVRRAAQFSDDIHFPGITVVFSWPSLGSEVKYAADENNADWSMLQLETFLKALRSKSTAGAIHIFAHSLGNRPVVHALSRLAERAQASFSEIILTAPDMDAATLMQHTDAIQSIASRLTLYASASDWPLIFSEHLHGSYPRAGSPGEHFALAREGFDPVDASSLAVWFSLNHSTVVEDLLALQDLEELLGYHIPAARRSALRPRDEGGWMFAATSR